MITLSAQAKTYPLKSAFRISRGAKTHAHCIHVDLEYEGKAGRGEAVPYARYGEDVEGELAKLRALSGLSLESEPRDRLPAGAARNALDCALWDLRAKLGGQGVGTLLDVALPKEVQTAQTLSLDTPQNMAAAAHLLPELALIKVKLGGVGDLERLGAIRDACPQARLIVDANEGWSKAQYLENIPAFLDLNVEMIEQPFRAGDDGWLGEVERPIPICADESVHVAGDIAALRDRYDMINIKLDKSGGLSEALDMTRRAAMLGMPYMIGCMVGSSLAMAPAFMLTGEAKYVDLDGSLFLREDEAPSIKYEEGWMQAPLPELWG